MGRVDKVIGHLSDIAWRKITAGAFAVTITMLFFIASTGRSMVEDAVDGRIRTVSAERVRPIEIRQDSLSAALHGIESLNQAFIVASMRRDPGLMEEMSRIADARDSGKAFEGKAISITRRLSLP
jgi:hypothetical protein